MTCNWTDPSDVNDRIQCHAGVESIGYFHENNEIFSQSMKEDKKHWLFLFKLLAGFERTNDELQKSMSSKYKSLRFDFSSFQCKNALAVDAKIWLFFIFLKDYFLRLKIFFLLLFIFIFIVQALSSEIVKQTKVCANIFKECKGMEDQALAYVDR